MKSRNLYQVGVSGFLYGLGYEQCQFREVIMSIRNPLWFFPAGNIYFLELGADISAGEWYDSYDC